MWTQQRVSAEGTNFFKRLLWFIQITCICVNDLAEGSSLDQNRAVMFTDFSLYLPALWSDQCADDGPFKEKLAMKT